MERRGSTRSKRIIPKRRKRKRPLFEPFPALTGQGAEKRSSSESPPPLTFQHDSILRVPQLPDTLEKNIEQDEPVLSEYSDSPPPSPQPPTSPQDKVNENTSTTIPKTPNLDKDFAQLKSGVTDGAKYVAVRVGAQAVPLSGSVWLSVLHGAVRVFGRTYTSECDPILIFSAPYAPFIVSIAAVTKQRFKKGQPSVSASLLHPDAVLNNRIRQSLRHSKSFRKQSCVIVLSSTSSDPEVWEASDGFHVSADLRSTLRAFNEKAGHPSISPGEELVDGMSIYPQSNRFRTFEEWPEWNSVCGRLNEYLEQATRPSDLRLLVCGESGSGKSTFTRCMMNQLLQKYNAVVFMDSDVGQSEMSPSGLVAAYCVKEVRIGSAAASNRQIPLAARFFGDTTPREDPDQYAAFIELVSKEALAFAQQHDYPVLINSDGWTNGTGADLLNHLTMQVDASHLALLRLQGQEPRRGIAELTSNFSEDRCFNLTTPRTERDLSFPPVLLRELHVASYFSKELALGRVYNVHIGDLELICVEEDSLNGISIEGLNASMVALGKNVSLDGENKQDWAVQGFGIVRGCDPDAGLLYICTPVDEERLELCDTLLFSGGVQIPQALFFSCASATLKSGMAPFILSGSVHTAEAMRSRGTLGRK
ncbi:P-loop containing nucleoside triphosphate hydrolase [Gracilaria domingensis]|nr:P-loop containing nucleoside triphosphate hydrolase [Gracilaria domingensis]